MKKIITCWFSCGVASAIAAKKTIDIYGKNHKIYVVNNPVIEEHSDNLRFLRDVEDWLGQKIHTATNKRYPKASAVEVWDSKKFMGNSFLAPCTYELKKLARYQWEANHPSDYIVLGFTIDELERANRFKESERGDAIFPLIDLGLSKQDCFSELSKAKIKPPAIYEMGFLNANCIGCIKLSSPTYWNHVRKHFPKIFQRRAIQSRKLGAKLVTVRGKRIFLDELSPETQGRQLKSWDCSSFCDSK